MPDFKARFGIGLMGRFDFCAGVWTTNAQVTFDGIPSSSELLCFLRVPARTGELGFLGRSSRATDFGRYFGSAVPRAPLLGFRVEEVRVRLEDPAGVSLEVLEPVSSRDALPLAARWIAALDLRVWVIVGRSTEACRCRPSTTGSSTLLLLPNPIVLDRRDCTSFGLDIYLLRSTVAFSLPSLLSLFITCAKAFSTEAKFNDCLNELLVARFAGLSAGPAFALSPSGIVRMKLKKCR